MNIRKLTLSLAGALAVCAGAMLAAPAQAAPAGFAAGLNAGLSGADLVEKAQYVYRGRRYCFYFDGWHGPGWYWCGYSHRRGYGWGGASGWRGWHHGRVYRAPTYRHPAPVYRHRAPTHRYRAPTTRHRAPASRHGAPAHKGQRNNDGQRNRNN